MTVVCITYEIVERLGTARARGCNPPGLVSSRRRAGGYRGAPVGTPGTPSR